MSPSSAVVWAAEFVGKYNVSFLNPELVDEGLPQVNFGKFRSMEFAMDKFPLGSDCVPLGCLLDRLLDLHHQKPWLKYIKKEAKLKR
jgi:hypothetical protein